MPIIRDYRQENGILVFDSDLDHRSKYDEYHLEILDKAERNHFWFSSRRDKICQIFEETVDKKCSILELGGGTGFIAESLIKRGYSVQMADIYQYGLRAAQKKGVKNLYQFDLFYPPFENEFDVICLFDVLEHLEDEVLALECINKMLKPGGKIILTVPAHQWLWSREDVLVGHKKRYTKSGLEKAFLAASLQPLYVRYFFMSILPLLFLRKYLKRDLQSSVKPNESVDVSLHPFLSNTLYYLTKLEFLLDRYLPNKMGGSLLAIAQLGKFSL